MKLTKHDFHGCRMVFSFTLKQLLQNRANLISFGIMFVLFLISMPMVTLFSGSGSFSLNAPASEDDILQMPDLVYVKNDTGLPLDFSDYEPEITFSSAENLPEGYAFDNTSVLLHIYEEETGITANITGWSGDISFLSSLVTEEIEKAKFRLVGAEPSQFDRITAPYTISMEKISEYNNENESDNSLGDYYLQLIYSILMMVVNMCAAAYIVQAVVEEKASKLVESLMISVRPLALILGKILAVMVFIIGMILVNAGAVLLSGKINQILFGENASNFLERIGADAAGLRLDPSSIVVCVLSLLLGFFTYSLIAGLSGTSCSAMEDLQAANSTSITILMLCYVIACFTSAAGNPVVNTLTSILPMLSIFCAPVQYMTGNIGFGVLAISWILQAAVIVALALLCAKIYADLIIYRGKPLGLRALFHMARAKKTAEEGNHP